MAIQRAKTMTILLRFRPCTTSYKGKFKQHYWVWGQHMPKGGKAIFVGCKVTYAQRGQDPLPLEKPNSD